MHMGGLGIQFKAGAAQAMGVRGVRGGRVGARCAVSTFGWGERGVGAGLQQQRGRPGAWGRGVRMGLERRWGRRAGGPARARRPLPSKLLHHAQLGRAAARVGALLLLRGRNRAAREDAHARLQLGLGKGEAVRWQRLIGGLHACGAQGQRGSQPVSLLAPAAPARPPPPKGRAASPSSKPSPEGARLPPPACLPRVGRPT